MKPVEGRAPVESSRRDRDCLRDSNVLTGTDEGNRSFVGLTTDEVIT